MDETFTPVHGARPPEGKLIELWHGGGIIKGYKADGAWHMEDGTPISVDGWRLIEKPAKPARLPNMLKFTRGAKRKR